jgi:hypothetical protein
VTWHLAGYRVKNLSLFILKLFLYVCISFIIHNGLLTAVYRKQLKYEQGFRNAS